MTDLDTRVREVEIRQTGHERECAVRYENIAHGMDAIHTFLGKIDRRMDSIESIRWALSGKMVAGMAGSILFLLGIIGWLLVNGGYLNIGPA